MSAADPLKCPSCAGQCGYSPGAGGLRCTSCGTVHDITEPPGANPAAEHPHDGASDDVPAPHQTDAYQCRSCGGEVIFAGAALSERCPYCDGPVVRALVDVGYETMALIPFRIEEAEAQQQAQTWAGNRVAAPRDLAATVAQARVAGLYAPFWTFDSDEAVSYWAKYTTGSGDNRRTHRTSGQMGIRFDDLLMPASPHVTPLIRDGILHDFRPSDLRSYAPGYLAGFAAERHHQSVAQGLIANAPDKKILIKNRIRARINKRGVHAITYNTDTTGIHYRRILLPVWILHYTYKGRAMKVVVSGIDGRTFGERPFSYIKLALYSALLSAAAIATGLAWGSAAVF
ncbi:hypothetical protein KDD17_06405 [Sulfitobacter albidus]|uniref:Primosomal protein N' (Replication factor Y)-superfamily II helicase n=1 Tax=Sulfitobacter albidus TaxID=2829501 RepID=A0A975JFP8_9RHOB|nr:hypothetical protein [Sulfitobacter albidus]QUJ77593.1 hypothetical protein KDD17_06405 [Sulfitobacter albidus]